MTKIRKKETSTRCHWSRTHLGRLRTNENMLQSCFPLFSVNIHIEDEDELQARQDWEMFPMLQIAHLGGKMRRECPTQDPSHPMRLSQKAHHLNSNPKLRRQSPSRLEVCGVAALTSWGASKSSESQWSLTHISKFSVGYACCWILPQKPLAQCWRFELSNVILSSADINEDWVQTHLFTQEASATLVSRTLNITPAYLLFRPKVISRIFDVVHITPWNLFAPCIPGFTFFKNS